MRTHLPPAAAPPPGGGRGGMLSLERKLPLLMTGILTVILAVSLLLTYATLRQSATDAAAERLRRVARQLASLGEISSGRVRARVRDVAADSGVRRLLEASAR